MQEIDAVIKAHENNWNSHNTPGFVGMFTSDADFVNVLGHHRHGIGEIELEFAGLHSSIMRESKIRMVEHSSRIISPTVAVAHARWEMTGMEKVAGWDTPDVRRGVLSYVMVLQDGRWWITSVQNTDLHALPPIGKA